MDLAVTNRERPRRQAEIREFRRRSLLRAALATVAEFDIEGATVARICARAGASRGLISHYFSNKEDLLVAALGGLFDEAQALKQEFAADDGKSPLERIRAIAHSSFMPPVFSWETAAAWQAFANASRFRPAFREPLRASSRESAATVAPLFEMLVKQPGLRIDANDAATGLFILIDGLWNRLAGGDQTLSAEQAKKHCDIYIDGCLESQPSTGINS